jgi:uncharacterized RDD family membrane protein YckC
MREKIHFFKLFASAVYEILVLVALWLAGTALYVSVVGDATQGYKRVGLQIFLWVLAGAYFVWCWCRSGQTLAMLAWRLQLVNQQNQALSLPQACLRYALASASLLAFGAGYWWALFDKDRLYLHDRLLKTHLIQIAKR